MEERDGSEKFYDAVDWLKLKEDELIRRDEELKWREKEVQVKEMKKEEDERIRREEELNWREKKVKEVKKVKEDERAKCNERDEKEVVSALKRKDSCTGRSRRRTLA